MSKVYVKSDSVSLYIDVGWRRTAVYRPVGISQFKKGDMVSSYVFRGKSDIACGVGKKKEHEVGEYDEYWYPYDKITDDLAENTTYGINKIWFKLPAGCLKHKCKVIAHHNKHPAVIKHKTCKWFLNGVEYTSTYDFCVARGDCKEEILAAVLKNGTVLPSRTEHLSDYTI